MNTPTPSIAWFITPHGFGHAARSAAVMLALEKRFPVHFHIFTLSPEWFFHESFVQNFTYHSCQTDIGLAQKTSLDEDLPETLRRLENFYPFDPAQISAMADQVQKLDCRLIVCDIAPIGIAVAQQAGLRSILVENFTWDWIYQAYVDSEPAFNKYIKILANWFETASDHIQTQPICNPLSTHLTTQPVSRPIRTARADIRARLSIPADQPVVLITMGGIETAFDYTAKLEQIKDICFVIPGGASSETQRANLRLLPHHSGFYHPDLVAASDAIVGKLGYSTLSEAYTVGIPYGYIPRSRFRESPPLAKYVSQHMSGLEIAETAYISGTWIDMLPDLLAQPRRLAPATNGADQLADWIAQYLG
jgi:hypothetical protein